MPSLVVGILLLLGGIIATAVSANTVYLGALVIGCFNIVRGGAQISRRPRN